MECQSERVYRCLEQRRIDVFVKDVERAVGREEHAVWARDHGRIWEVTVEDRVERATHRSQRFIVERGLRERWGEAGGAKQIVALPQRQLHRVREPCDDSGARPERRAERGEGCRCGRPGVEDDQVGWGAGGQAGVGGR